MLELVRGEGKIDNGVMMGKWGWDLSEQDWETIKERKNKVCEWGLVCRLIIMFWLEKVDREDRLCFLVVFPEKGNGKVTSFGAKWRLIFLMYILMGKWDLGMTFFGLALGIWDCVFPMGTTKMVIFSQFK